MAHSEESRSKVRPKASFVAATNQRWLDTYPWLRAEHFPDGNAIDWDMLTPEDVARFMGQYYSRMSRATYYRRVYPILHECQYGYDPHDEESPESQILRRIPRWVMIALAEEINSGRFSLTKWKLDGRR